MIDFSTSSIRPGSLHSCTPLLMVLLAVGLVSLAPAPSASRPLGVTVSILPLVWFVEEIGGDLVEVSVLVGPGHSPATYEPTPKQMAILENANLFLAAGVPFEQGLIPRIRALPKAPQIAGPQPVGHTHNHDFDPHTWLDPAQARDIADTVCYWLKTLSPTEAPVLQERCDSLKGRLTDLDTQAREILAPYHGRLFVVFHPAFGHFASAYGLVQVAIEAHGHQPGPRHLTEVIDLGRDSGARAVIIQPQFSQKSARTVADALDAEILVLDPLAADYASNHLHMAQSLADLFASEAASHPAGSGHE